MKKSKDSSSSSKGGNTSTPLVNKQISPAKRWCLTWNNYTFDWEEHLKKIISSKVPNKYIIGKEISSSGTKHLQGYIEFSKKIRPSSLQLSNKIHWEKSKGNRQTNITYCSKDNDFITNFVIVKPYKIDIEFYDWQERLFTILKGEPDDRTIFWVWEPEGCRGKTTFQKWVFLNMERVVVLSGKAADMKHQIVMYKQKNDFLPKIVLINVPRTSIDYLSYTGVEEIKDMFFFSPKYEGGMVCGSNPHVMIFANNRPRLEAMSEDRWHLIEV
jgi:hypothetical protein